MIEFLIQLAITLEVASGVGFLTASALYATPKEAIEAKKVVDRAIVTLERVHLDGNFYLHMLPKVKQARAILVVPSLLKRRGILGAEYGNGVLMVRNPRTNCFIGPARLYSSL